MEAWLLKKPNAGPEMLPNDSWDLACLSVSLSRNEKNDLVLSFCGYDQVKNVLYSLCNFYLFSTLFKVNKGQFLAPILNLQGTTF